MKKEEKVIFIIEDDAETVRLLRLMFRRHGIQIVDKPNGEEGLAAMRRQKPDLVLLDLMMPGIDGWEVLQKMSASPELCEIPIIVVTAVPEAAARLQGQSFDETVGYILKPFHPRPLLALVNRCLGCRST